MLRAVIVALVLLGAVPAAAQARSIAGRGRISLMPSLSYVPDGPFTSNSEYALGTERLPDTPLGYGGWASFGYGPTEGVEVSIDLMASTQTIRFEGREDMHRLTYGGGAGGRFIWQADVGSFQLQPRVALGVMATLVYVSGLKLPSSESFLTMYFAGIGTDFVVSESVGLSLEYRYLLGRGRAQPEIGGSINGGGHFLMLGFSYYLLGEPPHRSERL
jgi:opacity protein-like surface antigen